MFSFFRKQEPIVSIAVTPTELVEEYTNQRNELKAVLVNKLTMYIYDKTNDVDNLNECIKELETEKQETLAEIEQTSSLLKDVM